MADRYWVGGTGTWNSTSTTNWAISSGASAGASAPTSVDNVFFDANSNTGTTAFTVTATSTTLIPVCQNLTISGLDGALTLTTTNASLTSCLRIYGNLTLPSTNLTLNSTGFISFFATTTGKTITTNGISIGGVVFNGVGGEWTLQDTLTGIASLSITNGSLITNNQTINISSFSCTAAGSFTLGTSTLNLSGTTQALNVSSTTASAASSTINLTNNTTTSRTISFTALACGTINIGGNTSISTTTISASGGSIASLITSKTVAHTVSFASSLTINNWGITGTLGNVVTVNSNAVNTARTFTYTGSQLNLNYMSIKDINFSYTLGAANPYLVYANNSTNGGNNAGIAFIDGTTSKAYRLTTGTSFTVPVGWNSSNNNIYMLGAGGGGSILGISGNNRAAGGGGGGGGYTAITNFSTTAGSTITYAIGLGTANANGGNTTWNAGEFSAGGGLKGTATSVPLSTGGAGGTGSTFNGGAGGAGAYGTVASTGYGGGGGGGAGGFNGVGGTGGNGFASTVTANIASGGGGGNGGGSNGGNASSALGGNGGNNFAGVGGGIGTATVGGVGTLGGGGAGGAGNGQGGRVLGGVDFENSIGSGGGVGANAGTGTAVINNGYGGGGGGTTITLTGSSFTPGAGLPGVIFIVYSTALAATKQGGDDAPRSVKNLKYKPKPRKDDFGNEIVVPEAISALTVEKYTLKPTRVNANELQSHLEIDDEEAILMFI